jgi:hypothetical protein
MRENVMMNTKILQLVKKYYLDLTGLTVLTEAASGAYILNPFIALAAGARKVICKTKTTLYGDADEITNKTLEFATRWCCEDRIVIKENLNSADLSQADIITNSGHIRSITKKQIAEFKTTAVIPLMWETWEFREKDLDLQACKEKGILVLGTNESTTPCDMKKYSGMIGVKLLLELGLEVAGNKILLIGSTITLCSSIKDSLQSLGAEVVWFTKNSRESDFNYEYLEDYVLKNIANFDGIIIAEHQHKEIIFGEDGILTFSKIATLNPDIKVGISCGNIDVDDLKKSELFYFPKEIMPFGYMSYQSYHVGSLPVMDLFAAGLKVGEVMARARLNGMSVQDSAIYSIQNSPAMDFEGELAWL